MAEDEKSREGEVLEAAVQPENLPELLAAGASIIRLENDTQMQVAIQRPRNEVEILKSALNELTIYPSVAEEAIYSKPVGKDAGGKMKYAEGLSVRACESLINRWGNNAAGVQILGEDEEKAWGAAVFLDYENNNRRTLPFSVSKYYKKKGSKQMVKMPDDRFHDLKLKAECSKAYREVGLRSLPAGLKAEYTKKAKQIIADKSTGKDKKVTKKAKTDMLAAFKKFGVSQEQIEAYLETPVDKFEAETMTMLRGMWNAIDQGELKVEDVFAGKPQSESNGKVEGAADAGKLFSEGGEGKPGEEG